MGAFLFLTGACIVAAFAIGVLVYLLAPSPFDSEE